MVNEAMVVMKTENGEGFFPFRTREDAETFQGRIQYDGLSTKILKKGKADLDDLPEAVQEEILQTLRLYSFVNVEYENGRINVSPNACIKAEYGPDLFIFGTYYAQGIYMEKELRRIHMEEFGYRH